jgi:elongation factor G
MGELHLDIKVDILRRTYKVDANVGAPQVAYRETLGRKSEIDYTHKKQSGGSGQYARIKLVFEPQEPGKGYEFESKIVGGSVPKEYVPGVEKGVAESVRQGFIAGYPMVHIRVALVDGKYHPVDSSSQAFETAAHLGMKEAVALAGPTLLEPIMNVTITVPDANMGDISSDLNTKRGRIMGMEPADEGLQRITAQAPLAEMLHYATDLRSMTQGRGSFTMELSGYEEMPANLQQQVIDAHNKEKEAQHAHA